MYPETAQFYDFFAMNTQESQRRANFVSHFVEGSASRIIDVGSGTGEMAFMLADEAHSLFCFEPSASMYAILLERLRARKDLHSLVSTFPCHLEEVKASLKADTAYAFSVFSHVPLEQRRSMFEGLRRHLNPEGFLLFNCVQYTNERKDQPRGLVQEKRIGEVVYRHYATSKVVSSFYRQVIFEYEVVHHGQILKSYEDHFTLNLDSPEAVQDLLNEFGFRMLYCFSDFEQTDYNEKSPGFVVVATCS